MPVALGLGALVLVTAAAMARGVPSGLRWIGENAAPRWQQGASGEPG
jgi:hypothetical protein